MESDKAILIESDPDLQPDAGNQQTSVNIALSNELPPSPYDEVVVDQKEQHSLRRPARGLIVRRAGPSWGPIDSPIVLACIAVMLCGVFGVAALAFYSRSLSLNGDHVKSRRMRRSSLIVSVSGILTGIFLISVLGSTQPHHETYQDDMFWKNYLYKKSYYCDNYNLQACQKYGSYKDPFRGCTGCCSKPYDEGSCTNGWSTKLNGCRCDHFDNRSCLSNGFHFRCYDGCKECCPSYNILDCKRLGSYMSDGCLRCCGRFNSSDCTYGWKLGLFGCKTCCLEGEKHTCSLGWALFMNVQNFNLRPFQM